MIRILLVDDHEMVRAGLRALLGAVEGLHIAGEAGSVDAAVAEAARLAPDVVLMDLRLPDGSGIDACREILAANPAIQVLFLTSYAERDATVSTVLAGAAGYLLKDIGKVALVEAIRAAAGGRAVLDASSRREATQRLRDLKSLSRQESRVLELVADGKTNREIGATLGLSEKTVKNYLGNAFQKLGVERRSQAAVAFARARPQK